MEFPDLGEHCAKSDCNQLDFLPVECDSCHKPYCAVHFKYSSHCCVGQKGKDNRIPVCPLCGQPVPTPPGGDPDRTVGEHIDKQCQSDARKVYTNRCRAKGCKRKELIPVTCTQCRLNFCLGHRHPSDHSCAAESRPKQAATQNGNSGVVKGIFLNANRNIRALAGQAAEARRNVRPTTTTSQRVALQGNMSEDEALARALAASMEQQTQNNGTATTAAMAMTSTTAAPNQGRCAIS